MRIRYIEPVSSDEVVGQLADYLARVRQPGTEIEIVTLPVAGRPIDSLEYFSIEALSYPDIVRISHDSAKSGFDAVIIGCFYDPALIEAREVCQNTIIMGPCLASLQTVAHLANKASILVGRRKWLGRMETRVREYGYEHLVSSFRWSDRHVPDLTKDADSSYLAYLELAKSAVEEDGAEAIILGCTMNFEMQQRIQDKLGLPVVEPIAAALQQSEAAIDRAVRFGWTPSHIGTSEGPELNDETLKLLEGAPCIGKSHWVA